MAELKRVDIDGDYLEAWGCISTLGLGLTLLWTEAQRNKNKMGIAALVEWTATKTALHVGLQDRQGAIKVGLDVDLVIWDPDAEFKVCT